MNYYNDNDPGVCAWLDELINEGVIPDGKIDCRSICDVTASDLRGFTQCHFFAGIGGWPFALRLANWADDRPVWTASLPCQPWSGCGKQRGVADERHLWPVFFERVRECRPECLFGEQVERAVGLGWLDGIQADLETEGYTCGSVVLGAHSVGSPHRRQRIFWMAHAQPAYWRGKLETEGTQQRRAGRGRSSSLGDSQRDGLDARHAGNGCGQEGERREPGAIVAGPSDLGGMADSLQPRLEGHSGNGNDRHQPGRLGTESDGHAATSGSTGDRMDNTNGSRCVTDLGDAESQARNETRLRGPECGCVASKRLCDPESGGCGIVGDAAQPERGGHIVGDCWSRFELLRFRDGKTRRVEPGTFPLVARLPRGMVPGGDPSVAYAQATSEARTMRLKGYGNAIVPQVAAEFVKTAMDLL